MFASPVLLSDVELRVGAASAIEPRVGQNTAYRTSGFVAGAHQQSITGRWRAADDDTDAITHKWVHGCAAAGHRYGRGGTRPCQAVGRAIELQHVVGTGQRTEVTDTGRSAAAAGVVR